jgi:cytochrome c556
MNTSSPSPSRSTQARRYLAMFLVGLVVGAIATTMAIRAIEARQDHFDDAVMQVQQWHVNQLAGNIKRNRCSATDTLPHLRTLRALADDLEPAFPDLRDDARFAEHASRMRASLDTALASPPMSCPGLGAAVQNVREACKACHQDFRGS